MLNDICFHTCFRLDEKTQKMIEDIDKFGMKVKQIEEFLDLSTLEQLHNAIKEYDQNKTDIQNIDSTW